VAIKTYDPQKVTLKIGDTEVKGFVDGTFIKVAYDQPRWTAKSDVLGNVTRSKHYNALGKITFTLQQTSNSNKDLQGEFNAVDAKQINVLYKISETATITYASAFGWLDKMANVDYGNEAGSREWVITCSNLEFDEQYY